MSARSMSRGAAVLVVMVVSGCGSVPEFVLDAAYSAAQEAVTQKVEEVVGGVVDGVVDGIGQGDGLLPLGGTAGEGE